ncbi:MAG TPA: thiamine phosphate synthase [Polyangiaceae bacterium]
MRGLYPIVDVDSLKELGAAPHAVIDFADRVLRVRPPLLQLRAKHSGAKDTLKLLRALRPLCTRAGSRLIANDRPDLAVLAQCDGVHVGQDDFPLALVRQIAPGLLVGVSTHNLAQLSEALAEKPDYVAFGPVFSTSSKARPDPSVGVAGLAAAHNAARAAGIPLVAIGGINLARAPEVAPHCDLAAVIAALLPNPKSLEGVSESARALAVAFGGA